MRQDRVWATRRRPPALRLSAIDASRLRRRDGWRSSQASPARRFTASGCRFIGQQRVRDGQKPQRRERSGTAGHDHAAVKRVDQRLIARLRTSCQRWLSARPVEPRTKPICPGRAAGRRDAPNPRTPRGRHDLGHPAPHHLRRCHLRVRSGHPGARPELDDGNHRRHDAHLVRQAVDAPQRRQGPVLCRPLHPDGRSPRTVEVPCIFRRARRRAAVLGRQRQRQGIAAWLCGSIRTAPARASS